VTAQRYGWCPSIATPMAARDGLLVRVKPPAATLPADAARALADAAADCGNGLIDLTSRSNLQFRGLRTASVADFAAMTRAHGLAAADDAVETVRNVTCDPLGPDDPGAAVDSHAIARGIEALLAEDPRLRALPPKFGFLVDCGVALPIPDATTDIMLRALGDELDLTLDGGSVRLTAAAADAPALARRLARAFLALAGPAEVTPFRMRDLVAAVGEDAVLAAAGVAEDFRFKSGPGENEAASGGTGGDAITTSTAASSARAAASSTSHPDGIRASGTVVAAASPKPMYAAPETNSPVGYLRCGETGVFVVGVPRGRLEAAALRVLADLADRFGDATLRTTPWRALALPGISVRDAGAVAETAIRLGLIVDGADPRRALPGYPFEKGSCPVSLRSETASR
jgi:precorrin-3B synthase